MILHILCAFLVGFCTFLLVREHCQNKKRFHRSVLLCILTIGMRVTSFDALNTDKEYTTMINSFKQKNIIERFFWKVCVCGGRGGEALWAAILC